MAKYSKQKDGRYRTTVFTGQYDADGKPIKKYLSARTIKELDDKVAETRHLINSDAFIFDSFTTYGQFATSWLKVAKKGKSIATNAMYSNILMHTSPLNDVPLKDISRMSLQNIINDNVDHPRVCEQIRLTLKQIFEYAISEKLITSNPAKDLELPRRVKKEKRALTKEETEKIRNAFLPLNEKAFISTLYGTGMRPAEMYALTKADIDYDKGCIHINKALQFDKNRPVLSTTKTKSGIRYIVVSKSLLKLLKAYSQTLPYDNLFADDKGNYLSKSGYSNVFHRIMGKIFGMSNREYRSSMDITPYTFRHNFCTLMYYQGVSLKEAQRQMGHSSYSLVLDVYSHLDAEKENTSAKMDAICL